MTPLRRLTDWLILHATIREADRLDDESRWAPNWRYRVDTDEYGSAFPFDCPRPESIQQFVETGSEAPIQGASRSGQNLTEDGNMTTRNAIDCPREDCDGSVPVTLEWEPPDPHYGMDADGNRGMYVAGYWTAYANQVCSDGHTLTPEEVADIESDAVADQGDPADEYDGPDYDAEDDR